MTTNTTPLQKVPPRTFGYMSSTYTPPPMRTTRWGADAHKRYASLMTTGVAPAEPLPAIAPAPMPEPQVQPPAPVAPVAPGDVGYLPKSGSVAHRLCLMFLQHPGLSYTAADVARWFASKKDLVPNLLTRSVDAGLLQRKRDCAEVFYSAGAHIARIATAISHPTKEAKVAITKQIPAKAAKPATKKTPKDEDYSTPYKPQSAKVAQPQAVVELPVEPDPAAGVCLPDASQAMRTAPAVEVDISDIRIDDDVPLPVRVTKGQRMEALLAKLQLKQSAQLPKADYSMLSKAAARFATNGLGTFKTQPCKTDPDMFRVWRIA